jgi:threonine synthase
VRPWTRRYVCPRCGAVVEPDAVAWRCACGSPFVLEHADVELPMDRIRERPTTMWRYTEALPFEPGAPPPARVTMGEGWTPVVDAEIAGVAVRAKVEYASPTLSFKDRGAAVVVAKALELGARHLVADSSGNAGAAIAAYAARAGLPCDVFVARSTPAGKLAALAAVGAAIRLVDGTREDVAAAAQAELAARRSFYASHVYNPFFFEGTKTLAYELFEQLGRAPDVMVLPVGNGTLVLGAYIGFCELQRAGLIRVLPRFLAVQAAACAPVARAFESRSMMVVPVVNEGTIADGIAVAEPARGDEIVDAIRRTRGSVVTVSDDETVAAGEALARQGFYVEPTAAAPWAGLAKAPPEFADGLVVVPLCGAGAKTGVTPRRARPSPAPPGTG